MSEMSNIEEQILHIMSSATAVGATIYSCSSAFLQSGLTYVRFGTPIADIGLAFDEKAAAFAGIAAGLYWSIKIVRLLYGDVMLYRTRKKETEEEPQQEQSE